jgi:hypothetical protein
MGANQSSSVSSAVSVLQKSITNVVNTQSQSTSAQQSNVSNLSVKMVGASIKNCTFNFSQSIVADQRIKAVSTFNSQAALSNIINSAIGNAIAQNNSSVNGFLSTAFSNQNQQVNMTTTIQNIVENNINQQNLQNILAFVNNLNNNSVDLSYSTWDCSKQRTNGVALDSSQSMVVSQFVDSLTGLITEALMQNQQIASAVTKVSQVNTSRNTGVSELITALTGPFAIIVIGAIAFFLLGGGKIVSGGISTVSNPKKLAMLLIGIIMIVVVIKMLTKKKESFYYYRVQQKQPDYTF